MAGTIIGGDPDSASAALSGKKILKPGQIDQFSVAQVNLIKNAIDSGDHLAAQQLTNALLKHQGEHTIIKDPTTGR